MRSIFGFVLLLAAGLLSLRSGAVKFELENLPETCDFSRCTQPDKDKINVHLVPHSHDDVGWKKTVEQYFYGTRQDIRKAGVQYILDNVVQSLIRNKQRRFIYVETAFFWLWWQEQTNQTQAIVHELVRSGQLEFINGGLSMADEATTQYNAVIDQLTWGHRRLKDTFGQCGIPRATWQIDPFGHSREFASMFAQMNFDAVYFAREHYQEAEQRQQAETLEHVWQGSDDIGEAGDLFTGLLANWYCNPDNMNWDLSGIQRDAEPVIDNADSEEYNVDKIVKMVEARAEHYSKYVTHNNVLFPMGCDFTYREAIAAFKNMDKLIKAVNAKSNMVKVFYSTPSCYTKAIYDTGRMFSTKTDDYLNYASDAHHYWVGYYTSRPSLKRLDRVGNNLLQACKQLNVLAAIGQDEKIVKLKEAMGYMQHHDAITGTEKQHVADNYAKKVSEGIDSCQEVMSTSVTKLVKINAKLEYCNMLNISQCAVTENMATGKMLAVNIYNPLAKDIDHSTIRLPVLGGRSYEVYATSGYSPAASIIAFPKAIASLPERASKATHDLIIPAGVPALGYTTYYVKPVEVASNASAKAIAPAPITKPIVLKSNSFDLHLDSIGQLSSISFNGSNIMLRNELRYYESSDQSGAYVFVPKSTKTTLVGKVAKTDMFTLADGTVELHQQFNESSAQQIIRLFPKLDLIEFEWLVGPIPVGDGQGKEYITQYITDLHTDRTFYTDANGRQMLKRVWNQRPAFKLKVDEPIAGNYYPINSRIFLRDETKGVQLTVLTDRSHGATSPKDGAIEIMLHRRMLHDDNFGVLEALNEPGADGKGLIVRGRHRLFIDNIAQSTRKHRMLSQQFMLEPVLGFIPNVQAEAAKASVPRYSALLNKLPANVHLLTLEQWKESSQYLVRFEHFFQTGEDAELSKPATIKLQYLFANFEVVGGSEVTLSANQDISALSNRLVFKHSGNKTKTPTKTSFDAKKLEVVLNPFEIRTFLLTFKQR